MVQWKIYQWIKDDLLRVVEGFYRGARVAKVITTSFIVLIPKVDDPHFFDEFRLI